MSPIITQMKAEIQKNQNLKVKYRLKLKIV